jgi:hypothetical protein
LFAHQQVCLRDAWAALARNLVAARHVDDVDDEISQLTRKIGGQIV